MMQLLSHSLTAVYASSETASTLDAGAVGDLAGDFCITWFGSVALGVFCGLVAALVLKFARLGHFSDESYFHFIL